MKSSPLSPFPATQPFSDLRVSRAAPNTPHVHFARTFLSPNPTHIHRSLRKDRCRPASRRFRSRLRLSRPASGAGLVGTRGFGVQRHRRHYYPHHHRTVINAVPTRQRRPRYKRFHLIIIFFFVPSSSSSSSAFSSAFSSDGNASHGRRRAATTPSASASIGESEMSEAYDTTRASVGHYDRDPSYCDKSVPPPKEWHSRGYVNEGRMYSETFPVRFDEVGPDKKTTMRTVASMIQECTCNHSQAMWGRAMSTHGPCERPTWRSCALDSTSPYAVSQVGRSGRGEDVVGLHRASARRDWELCVRRTRGRVQSTGRCDVALGGFQRGEAQDGAYLTPSSAGDQAAMPNCSPWARVEPEVAPTSASARCVKARETFRASIGHGHERTRQQRGVHRLDLGSGASEGVRRL